MLNVRSLQNGGSRACIEKTSHRDVIAGGGWFGTGSLANTSTAPCVRVCVCVLLILSVV